MVRERIGYMVLFPDDAMVWFILTVKGMYGNYPGLFKSYAFCFRWMRPCILRFYRFYPYSSVLAYVVILAYPDFSLGKSQFTNSSVNPFWSFQSSVVPPHNNESSFSSCNNNNDSNNIRLHFLRFHCVPGPVWSCLHAVFHLILIKIQLDKGFLWSFPFYRSGNWRSERKLAQGQRGNQRQA